MALDGPADPKPPALIFSFAYIPYANDKSPLNSQGARAVRMRTRFYAHRKIILFERSDWGESVALGGGRESESCTNYSPSV